MNSAVSISETPDGRRFVVSRTIDAPREVVWELFVEPRHWPEWSPSVTTVDCPDQRIRTGSSGKVRIVGGLWVPFTVTSSDGNRWTWRVAGIPATGHQVVAEGNGSKASFEIPLWGLPYIVVCDRALTRLQKLATGNASAGNDREHGGGGTQTVSYR